MCPPPKKKTNRTYFEQIIFPIKYFFFEMQTTLAEQINVQKVYFIFHIQCPEFGVCQPYNNY